VRGENRELEPKAAVGKAHPTASWIVRATGVCCRCDRQFRDELVLTVSDPRVPSGVVYIELRHLVEGDVAAERPEGSFANR
jgi:hypothetical protein